ncbi:MAG: cache domain-containing protein [Bdellovibrionales bacterium]|nr:cache domain-containing protein [Bdellovibrionales bacterium]
MKYFNILIIFTAFLSLIGINTACQNNSGRVLRTTAASQVKNRQSLKNFVLDAKNYLEKDYNKATNDFRKKDGPWRHEEVYLFIVDESGTTLFHAGIPIFEGQRVGLIDLDTGEYIVDSLIRTGLQWGGGFIEYRFDNPETSEKENNKKITYVTPFRRSEGDLTLIIGAGFFPDE